MGMDGKKVICGISEMKYFYIFDAEPSVPAGHEPNEGVANTSGNEGPMVASSTSGKVRLDWKSSASFRSDYDVEVLTQYK
jgi:hypothetical protein